MNFMVTTQFFRRNLVITCQSSAEILSETAFNVTIGGLTFSSPFHNNSSKLHIPLDSLEQLPDLSHHLTVTQSGSLTELPPDPLLSKVDIRSKAEFLERIQSLRKRITDPEAVRFCARRFLATADAAPDIRAAAICALGYRIVESLDQHDPDLVPFWHAVEALLKSLGDTDALVRWTTSVTMVATYVAILQDNASETVRFLQKTLSYRPHLPQLSLLHTNFSRCDTLLAIIEMARGEKEVADSLLADVNQVFQVGVRSSWIDHPLKGRNQYSEIFAVLKSLRTATAIRMALAAAETRAELTEVAFKTPIASISNITRALYETKHWHAVLQKISIEKNSRAEISLNDSLQIPPLMALTTNLNIDKNQIDISIEDNQLNKKFRSAIGALASAVEKKQNAEDFFEQLDALMQMDQEIRHGGDYLWSSLLDLARIRFRIAYLELISGRKDKAYSLLVASTIWTKDVLSSASIEKDQDFDAAGLFVLCGQIAYLAAHRYVEPKTPHVTESAIDGEIQRLIIRVFKEVPDLSLIVAKTFNIVPLEKN